MLVCGDTHTLTFSLSLRKNHLKNLFSGLLYFHFLKILGMSVCVCVFASTNMKVRGQPLGVSSQLPPCGSWVMSPGLVASALTH